MVASSMTPPTDDVRVFPAIGEIGDTICVFFVDEDPFPDQRARSLNFSRFRFHLEAMNKGVEASGEKL